MTKASVPIVKAAVASQKMLMIADLSSMIVEL
jgi:hypothetical protein